MHGAAAIVLVAVIAFAVVFSLYAVSVGVSSPHPGKQVTTVKTVAGVVTTATTTTSQNSAGVKVGSTATITDVSGNKFEVSTEPKLFQLAPLDSVSVKTPDGKDSILYDSIVGKNGDVSEVFSFMVGGVSSINLVEYYARWEVEGGVIAELTNKTSRSIPVGSKFNLPAVKVTGSQIYDKLKGGSETSKSVVFKVDLSLAFKKWDIINDPEFPHSLELRTLTYQGANLQATFSPTKGVVPTEIKATNLPVYDLSINIQVNTPQGFNSPQLVASGSYLVDATPEFGGPVYNPVSGLQLKTQYGYRLTEQYAVTVGSIKLYGAVKTVKGSIVSQPSLVFTDTRVATLQPAVQTVSGFIYGAGVLVSAEDVKGQGVAGFFSVSSDGGEAKDEFTGKQVKLYPVKPVTMVLYSFELSNMGDRVKWLSTESSTEQVSGWKIL